MIYNIYRPIQVQYIIPLCAVGGFDPTIAWPIVHAKHEVTRGQPVCMLYKSFQCDSISSFLVWARRLLVIRRSLLLFLVMKRSEMWWIRTGSSLCLHFNSTKGMRRGTTSPCQTSNKTAKAASSACGMLSSFSSTV